MRWKIPKADWSERDVVRFAWLPIVIGDHKVWLERYVEHQSCRCVPGKYCGPDSQFAKNGIIRHAGDCTEKAGWIKTGVSLLSELPKAKLLESK